MEETVNAMSLSDKNPYFVKFQEEGFHHKKIERHFQKNDDYDPTEFLFTCYMTRKYFKDCIYISLIKLFFGSAALFLLILMDTVLPVNRIAKPILMPFLLGYGLIMCPLSILYIVTNLWCYVDFLSYVSTGTSSMAKRIAKFYDPDTDKFVAVNWSNVISRDKSDYTETKRKRGW